MHEKIWIILLYIELLKLQLYPKSTGKTTNIVIKKCITSNYSPRVLNVREPLLTKDLNKNAVGSGSSKRKDDLLSLDNDERFLFIAGNLASIMKNQAEIKLNSNLRNVADRQVRETDYDLIMKIGKNFPLKDLQSFRRFNELVSSNQAEDVVSTWSIIILLILNLRMYNYFFFFFNFRHCI